MAYGAMLSDFIYKDHLLTWQNFDAENYRRYWKTGSWNVDL